jgi:DNA-3-methyladenine glycosylase II
MPAARTPRPDPWYDALAHLRALDATWERRIADVGPCTLRPRRDAFPTLVRSILSQQISTKAARSIEARLLDLTGRPVRPEALLGLSHDQIRTAGLSSQKARYLHGLAEEVATGRLPLHRARRWDDDEVITRLTALHGVGRWTAEMFLIFVLNRPDVLPVDDLGARVGIQRHYGLAERPGAADCRRLAEPWRPYRSVATWYLWREADLGARPTA